LRAALPDVENANVQREYYLTDLVQIAAGRGWNVQAVTASDPMEFLGVNTEAELEAAEEIIVQRTQGH
jgi:bifunctional UDP-N-acetylglucosamine pyrophosphorylase/glucosamine-1-phosphate N-acetyltransferase